MHEDLKPLIEKALSEARLAANRENAQKSHGAVTEEGKAVCRLNALRTGLTGVTVLLPDDDVALYDRHIRDFEMQFQPVGPLEKSLCQSIADTIWRLNRIPALEMAIYSTGRSKLLFMQPHLAEPGADATIDMLISRDREKELRNLHLQEGRLVRRRDKEISTLASLQTIRKRNEPANLEKAAKATLLATHRKEVLETTPGLGFEFTNRRFETHMATLNAAARKELLEKALAEAPAEPVSNEAAA